MAGIEFFPIGPKTNIIVKNLDDCNKKIFGSLLEVEIMEVIPVRQFWFDEINEKKFPKLAPINDQYFYQFTAQQAIDSLKKIDRQIGIWGLVDSGTKVYLNASACEEV